jgi:hypothetical protein
MKSRRKSPGNGQYRFLRSISPEQKYICILFQHRKPGPGFFADQNKNRWIVPASVALSKARKAIDLYNQCAYITPASINDVNIDSVPIVEIDYEGEVIIGIMFADNYFELYVNGHLVGVDSVPFTPFNTIVVRFRDH